MGWSGRKGKREARKNREASRHGGKEEKREKKTQMERPELVAATRCPPNKDRNSEAKGPGAEHSSCSLDQGTIGWSSSEGREEAERACRALGQGTAVPGKLGVPGR